jgi:curved DNA-binding protein CbpA
MGRSNQVYGQMNNKRYFEILELAPDASMDALNQAYRDLVNIWHPDRFTANPRLQKKAEEKLKELNQAYEALKPVLSSESGLGKNAQARFHGSAQEKPGAEHGPREAGNQAGAKTDTEAVVEAGTATVLGLWSYLSTRLRRLVAEQVQAFKEGAQIGPRGGGLGQGRGKGKGRGGSQGRRQFRGGGRRSGGTRGGMGGRSS